MVPMNQPRKNWAHNWRRGIVYRLYTLYTLSERISLFQEAQVRQVCHQTGPRTQTIEVVVTSIVRSVQKLYEWDHYLLSWTKLGSVQQVVVVQDCTDFHRSINFIGGDMYNFWRYWSLGIIVTVLEFAFYGLRLWCDFSRGLIVLELSMLSRMRKNSILSY